MACDYKHITITCLFLAEDPKGYEWIWFLGDDFAATSERKYFLERDDNVTSSFIKQNFEFNMSCSSRYSSLVENMLVRLQNSFAYTLNRKTNQQQLPKYMVVVLDDDLITHLNYKARVQLNYWAPGYNGWYPSWSP